MLYHEDRWGQVQDSWYVSTKVAGFVTESVWETISKMQQGIDKNSGTFTVCGTVYEFNLIVDLNQNKEFEYRRHVALLGEYIWVRI